MGGRRFVIDRLAVGFESMANIRKNNDLRAAARLDKAGAHLAKDSGLDAIAKPDTSEVVANLRREKAASSRAVAGAGFWKSSGCRP